MHCMACGMNLPSNAAFCAGCGKPAPKSHETPTMMEPARISPTATISGADPMRTWWVTFGIVLFVALFIPVAIDNGTLRMFWDYFDAGLGKIGVWMIMNAVIGITVFTMAFVFPSGLVRGTIMASCGLLLFIMYMILATGGGAPLILGFALIAVAVMLAGCLLRQHNTRSLTARLIGGISGGIAVVMSVIAIILTLSNIANGGGNWAMIIDSVLNSLITLLAVAAGILSLVLIGAKQNIMALLRATQVLISIYLLCGLCSGVLMPILNGLAAFEPSIETIGSALMLQVPIVACVIIYVLTLGIGLAEFLKKIVPPSA